MKKLLILLLFVFYSIPIFSQKLEASKNKNPNLNLLEIKNEIITVSTSTSNRINKKRKHGIWFDISYLNEENKNRFKVNRKSKIYSDNKLVTIYTTGELIEYFEKWNFIYEGSTNENQVIAYQFGNINVNTEILSFRNGNIDGGKKKKLTSMDEAILQIKKLKELLDLGIISQDEYDLKSDELKKIILD